MIHVIKTTVEDGKKTVRKMALTPSTWQRILDKKLREDNVSYELQKATDMPKAVDLTADKANKVEPKAEEVTPEEVTPEEPKAEPKKATTKKK